MRNVTSLTLVISFALCIGHALYAQPGTPSGGHYPNGQAGTDFNVNNAKNNKDPFINMRWDTPINMRAACEDLQAPRRLTIPPAIKLDIMAKIYKIRTG